MAEKIPVYKIGIDEEDENITDESANGWVAMLQHYFFTALLPGSIEDTYRYYTLNPDKKSYVIGAVTPAAAALALGQPLPGSLCSRLPIHGQYAQGTTEACCYQGALQK